MRPQAWSQHPCSLVPKRHKKSMIKIPAVRRELPVKPNKGTAQCSQKSLVKTSETFNCFFRSFLFGILMQKVSSSKFRTAVVELIHAYSSIF